MSKIDDDTKKNLQKLGVTEAEFVKMSDNFVKKYNIVRQAIVDNIDNGASNPGTMPCPICKTGVLRYSQARNYNNHVHACCSTKNCIQFVE